MIDEKGLEDLRSAIQCGECIDPITAEELIRLARLGLWAQTHGVPVIREHADCGADRSGSMIEAIIALPEEEQ